MAPMKTSLYALALLAVIGIYSFLHSPYFELRELEVEGTQLLSPASVLEYAGIPERINIFEINDEVVVERLEAQPWISKARLSRELPGRLVIRIHERKPLVRISRGSSYLLADAEAAAGASLQAA